MITGETKAILTRANAGAYDHFLFFGKKKKKTLSPEQKQAKKEKRQKFWRDVASEFKEGSTSKTIAQLLAGGSEAPASDYQINYGKTDQTPPEPPKKGIPTVVIVIGGVALFAAALYGYSKYRSRKLKLT